MAGPIDLDRLYAEHAQALFAFVLNFTRNEADTRDVLQEVFLKLATRPGLLDSVRDEHGFLLRLAHNQAVDVMRRNATRRKTSEALSMDMGTLFAPATDPDQTAFDEALTSALGNLPPEQRAVVHLKLWEGLTFEQIAASLEIPPNTAASRYRYGIDKLRELLRPVYDEIEQPRS